MAIRRRGRPQAQSLDQMVADTADMVGQLVRENRALKAENLRLSRELERVTKGWDEVRKLARLAPRRRSGR